MNVVVIPLTIVAMVGGFGPSHMQLAEHAWGARVSQAIYERFNYLAKAAFRKSPALSAKVSYTVTADGHVTNVKMPQKSTNVLFNVLAFQAVKSLDGDMQLLRFPDGCPRAFFERTTVFTVNVYPDFRYSAPDDDVLQWINERHKYNP